MVSGFFLVYFEFPQCCQYQENRAEDERGCRESHQTEGAKSGSCRLIVPGYFECNRRWSEFAIQSSLWKISLVPLRQSVNSRGVQLGSNPDAAKPSIVEQHEAGSTK
jgi:hypothetical protein